MSNWKRFPCTMLLLSFLIALGLNASSQGVVAAQAAAEQTSVSSTGTIAYVVNGTEIWLMAPDGSDKRRIWQAPAATAIGINSLAWSPDGTEIAFASGHEATCSLWASDLYGIRPDGSGLRRITNGPACAELANYPKATVRFEIENKLGAGAFQVMVEGSDGYPIYLFQNEVKEVTMTTVADLGPGIKQCVTAGQSIHRWWKLGACADLEAGKTHDLGRFVIDGDFDVLTVSKPTWSPNSSSIAFLAANGIPMVVNRNPGLLNRGGFLLGDGVTVSATDIEWSPTGNNILYSNHDYVVQGIYLAPVGGNSQGTRVAEGEADSHVAWLHDGSGFVFTKSTWGSLDKQLFLYRFAGAQETQLTSLTGNFTNPSVSLDNQRIAFEVTVQPPAQDPITMMQIIDIDGNNRQPLDDNGRAPAWGVPVVSNHAPTDITLSSQKVTENLPAGTTVGTLSTTDADGGDNHSYSLVAGTGSEDNGSFTTAGNALKTAAAFDFETKSSYSVRIRSDDGRGGTFDKVFAVTVTDVDETTPNHAPTDVNLSDYNVLENLPAGSTVGTLSTTDADGGDNHSYSLVAGAGSEDNGSFTIAGNVLQTAAVFDFEAKSSYSIRIRSDDGRGGTADKVFSVFILVAGQGRVSLYLPTTMR